MAQWIVHCSVFVLIAATGESAIPPMTRLISELDKTRIVSFRNDNFKALVFMTKLLGR
jgi:hypothetical protein